MFIVSYEQLLDGIDAMYSGVKRKRALDAVEAVIRYGGATRGKNNWCGFWNSHDEYVLYFQRDASSYCPNEKQTLYYDCGGCDPAPFAPCRMRKVMEHYCRCKCDFLRCSIPDWDNLYKVVFCQWEEGEILETYGLF